jgi:hypothetical protein
MSLTDPCVLSSNGPNGESQKVGAIDARLFLGSGGFSCRTAAEVELFLTLWCRLSSTV